MILQVLHLFFTEARTLINLQPFNYSAFFEVVGAKLHHNLVANKDFYIVHSHFPRKMAQRFRAVREQNTESGAWQRLCNLPLFLNAILWR